MLWPIFSLLQALSVALDGMTGTVFHFEDKTTVDILKEASYPVETHVVTTEDGYVLTMHRITGNKNNVNPASKGPVFLMHGLLCSSADWIVIGDKSLGIILAEAGYDVWMGNNRGNTYSRGTVDVQTEQNAEAYFDYSYHEIGYYDLPAMIDYVLNKTSVTQMPYVGFSEGTTSFLVLMSTRPEYNEKISTMVSWAPVTNMYRISSWVINFLAKNRFLDQLAISIRWYEMFPHMKIGNLFRGLCVTSDELCNLIFKSIGSSDERIPNNAMKMKILQNFPAGMSLKQVMHYVQGTRSGVFRPFVYNTATKNKQVYGNIKPDPYNLSAVTVPIIMYYGGSDILVSNDILLNQVVKELKNVTTNLAPVDHMNHLDFIWSKDVDWLTQATLEDLENITASTETGTNQISKATKY